MEESMDELLRAAVHELANESMKLHRKVIHV